MGFFEVILLKLLLVVGFILAFAKLKIPAILAYLSVGIFTGPGALAIFEDPEQYHYIAHFGVTFLMFTIGLEISIPQISRMKKNLFLLGGLQVTMCTIIGFLIGKVIGLDASTSFICSAILALSSTAVVIKQLTDLNEIHTPHGKMALSILIFQDIAAIFFLITFNSLSHGSEELVSRLLLAILKGTLTIVIMAIIGNYILRPILKYVAKFKSTELFMITALLVVLGAAWVTEKIGLSQAFGAFIAGMMLAETEFKHQFENDIKPFRDVLLGLFFIVIGSLFRLDSLPHIWHYVLALLSGSILLKFIVILTVCRIFSKNSFLACGKTSLILSQGGELGFTMLAVALENGSLQERDSQVLIGAVVISIFLAPFLITYKRPFLQWFFKITPELSNIDKITKHCLNLKNHIIICGFGRRGQALYKFIEETKIPCVIVDLDRSRISNLALTGDPVFFGDATKMEILLAANISQAKMLVSSFTNLEDNVAVITQAKPFKNIKIFSCSQSEEESNVLVKTGASIISNEKTDAALMQGYHILKEYGINENKINSTMNKLQTNDNLLLKGFFSGDSDHYLFDPVLNDEIQLHAIVIEPEYFASSKSIANLKEISQLESLQIKSIIRGKNRHNNPASNTVIKARDVLVLYGTNTELFNIENIIYTGKM